jgi:hypothetical protein
MAYLIFLVIALATIISATTGYNPAGSLIDGAKDKIKTTTLDFAFPKSEKEILIDNITEQYNLLDRFFVGEAIEVLESDTSTEEEKEYVRKALETFSNSKIMLEELKNREEKDNSIIKSVVKKILNLDSDTQESPGPTYIPPQCHIVCPDREQ